MRYFSVSAFSPALGEILLSAFLTSFICGTVSLLGTESELSADFIKESPSMERVLTQKTKLKNIILLEVFILITNDIFSNSAKNIHINLSGDDSTMKKLDSIRSNQNIRQNKKEVNKIRRERSKSRRTPAFRAFVMALKIAVISAFVLVAVFGVWIYAQIDFQFGDNLAAFDLKLSSTIYVSDGNGDYREYDRLKSTDHRVWVDIEDVPEDMQDAFVAIEDERFYTHHGVDIKRTMGAVLNVFLKGDSSYGGSTITQQLVKNITQDRERTNARKIREISRALVLETKLSKSQILELYMNSIYLSQGVHGVQAASQTYFGKDVDELSLAQCASIAGITQYPTTFDPILNPENNRSKQLLVLSKMLERGFISEAEYDNAVAEKLDFSKGVDVKSSANDGVQSYFTDHVLEEAKKDLMKEFEYTEDYAEQLLYNGGYKIYATLDPELQDMAEEYYRNDDNFPKLAGNTSPQSAIIISDPSTGELKALIGGRGEKTENRGLNRATQSKRQPGSSIKPIAVYAPAIEENVVNLSTYIDNSAIKKGSWQPKNSNGRFTGPVSIKTAVAWSYNMPAIRTLEALTIDTCFEYLKDKLHMNSIIDEVTRNGKKYSDRNLSLALGGLTDGVTLLEMSTAYSSLANGGMYIEPISYTKICDKDDNLIFENKPQKNRVFSEETAFLTQELLKGVVTNGTATGNTIKGMDTCGKTGTTDDNMDKWFVGFTPHLCATVWFGYDKPQTISTGTNPSIKIWKDIMVKAHEGLDNEKFEKPDGIVKAQVCGYTGKYASTACGTMQYTNKKFLTGYCRGSHPKTPLLSGKAYVAPKPSTPADSGKTDKTDKTDKKEDNKTDTGTDTNKPSTGGNTAPSENTGTPPAAGTSTGTAAPTTGGTDTPGTTQQ